ncbi:hypothetical protein [Azoarcus sp. CIB]|nr:hypothetical protein [Azoarcus sp. CIB]
MSGGFDLASGLIALFRFKANVIHVIAVCAAVGFALRMSMA